MVGAAPMSPWVGYSNIPPSTYAKKLSIRDDISQAGNHEIKKLRNHLN